MRNRVLRTGLDAEPAKDATAIVDVVNPRKAFVDPGALLGWARIVRRFDIDAFGRTSRGAKKTGDAFFAAKLIYVEQMLATIARLHRDRLVRILNSLLALGNVRKCHA